MYGDDAIGRDMKSCPLHSSTFKHSPDGEFVKMNQLISSHSYSNYNHHEQNHNYSGNDNQNQNQQHGGQTESLLMRYRSAPSSFYASLVDESGCDDFLEENFLSSEEVFQSDSHEFLKYTSSSTQTKEEGIPKVNLPMAMYGGSYNHANHDSLRSSSTLGAMSATRSNLIRQSSSPAGFLSSLNAETGFSGINDVEKTISSSRTNSRISFSTISSSSRPFLPQTAENKNEINDYTFKSLKRTRNGDSKIFPSSIALDIENGSSRHYAPSLVHHMSLPKTFSEMATAEKLLRFEQDSVPCKIRAKRGCATHPRSIAERVRRTRISERMKKIQALFPNMDKQTSTSDMLDLAVQYIKDLQKELQTLNDAQSKCSCLSEQ